MDQTVAIVIGASIVALIIVAIVAISRSGVTTVVRRD
jgi:multisubunit Na+/H+ antiporter MnhC subunit